jgi:hypothetical protein
VGKFTPEQREKLKSIRIGTGPNMPKPVYGVRPDGERTKAVTDELGNVQTYHTDGRVDVEIKAPKIQLVQKEVRGE